MSYVLFYSTNNKHSETVLQFITKNILHQSGDFEFISLDQRRIVNSCIYVSLSNNANYLLPPCVNSVPTMIDKVSNSNQIVLSGTSSVISHLQEKKRFPKKYQMPNLVVIRIYRMRVSPPSLVDKAQM